MAAQTSEVAAMAGGSAHGLFHILERPRGMGMGVVACAPIPAGTVICEDHPLLVLRGDDIGVTDLIDKNPADHKVYHARAPAVLLAQYKALPAAGQRSVAELYDCHESGDSESDGDGPNGKAAVRKMLLAIAQKTLGISEGAAAKMYSSDCGTVPGLSGTKSVFGIFKTNAIPHGTEKETAQGLYPLISRFNHSCLNNAVYQWRDGLQTNVVTATRDIAAGEEICVSYFKSLYMTHDERVKRTVMTWGFKCQCPACEVVPEGRQEEFEATRARIQALAEANPELEDSDVQHLIPPEHQKWMDWGIESDNRRERLWRLNGQMERASGLRVGMLILKEMQRLYEEEQLLPSLTIERLLVHDKLSLLAIYGGAPGDLEEIREATRELCRLEELLHGNHGNKDLERFTKWRDSKRGGPTALEFGASLGMPSMLMPGGGSAPCPTQ